MNFRNEPRNYLPNLYFKVLPLFRWIIVSFLLAGHYQKRKIKLPMDYSIIRLVNPKNWYNQSILNKYNWFLRLINSSEMKFMSNSLAFLYEIEMLMIGCMCEENIIWFSWRYFFRRVPDFILWITITGLIIYSLEQYKRPLIIWTREVAY